jgi:PD-(D/E)XK nuclease superfamily protein
MGEQELNFKNFKQRGEWVEMLFMARAAREGLQVSKPYGDSAHYDFIVESHSLCSRVQVKSTLSRFQNGFRCNLRASMSKRYELNSFDFAAVYIIPVSVWFIIPMLTVKMGLLLTPGKQNSKYFEYEEAWYLRRPADDSKAKGPDLIEAAEIGLHTTLRQT